jgi:hypothetical protein
MHLIATEPEAPSKLEPAQLGEQFRGRKTWQGGEKHLKGLGRIIL